MTTFSVFDKPTDRPFAVKLRLFGIDCLPPVPRQEFVESVGRVLGDAGQDIGQPVLIVQCEGLQVPSGPIHTPISLPPQRSVAPFYAEQQFEVCTMRGREPLYAGQFKFPIAASSTTEHRDPRDIRGSLSLLMPTVFSSECVS
jgi:hypothetical protein